MRTALLLLCIVSTLLIHPQCASASDKQNTQVRVEHHNSAITYITVSSDKEFYVGGNKFILYVGGKTFDLYEQINEDGKGTLKFIIPIEIYRTLANGSELYMSYGMADDNEISMLAQLAKQPNEPYWHLGKLKK